MMIFKEFMPYHSQNNHYLISIFKLKKNFKKEITEILGLGKIYSILQPFHQALHYSILMEPSFIADFNN